jgi:hypothetical protein
MFYFHGLENEWKKLFLREENFARRLSGGQSFRAGILLPIQEKKNLKGKYL